MRRIIITSLSVFIALGLTAVAVASSVHLKGKPALTFTDQGLVLNATGALAGLGNGDILVNLSGTAQPTATCTNQGGNQAAGQNPATVQVGGSQAIPASAVKNGSVSFSVTTQAPSQPTWDQAGCPSSNWTAQITDMNFSGASFTLSVLQGGNTVFTQAFTIP